jgi:O-antigen/teichoic acid export membrane protein
MNLAIPSVLSMLVNILYNLTDTFFIGKLNDPHQVAAVSISMPLFTLQMAMAGIFGIGGGSYLSRLLGQKNNEAARNTLATSVFTAALLSIVLGFAVYFPFHSSEMGVPAAIPRVHSSINLFYSTGSPAVQLKFTMCRCWGRSAAKEAMIGLFNGMV